MKEEKCPCCPNHCSLDNLSCDKGRAYFMGNDNNLSQNNTIEEKVINDLRECGHMLHHNKDINVSKLLSVYTNEELKTLHQLLSKIK